MKFVHQLVSAIEARQNCIKTKNEDWQDKWEAVITKLGEFLPSGSGFDSGTVLVLEKCTDKELQFRTAFHHMDQNGYYTKWTDHLVVVTPVLSSDLFSLYITGLDHKGIKEYIHETFYHVLHNQVPEGFLRVVFEREGEDDRKPEEVGKLEV